MSGNNAIIVKNLSKSYKLYNTPKDRMKELLHPFKKKYHRNYQALDDISFEVPRGTTFGIIGRNGAGKSTLLQLICDKLTPTSGSIEVKGRISALLELGAGFNREFTGRENIFLQGALMGITRKEMEKRFDEIADFADIGDFIDQPAKTYSSGMYVRLGFAVAINVDPDILIVDEALAVGDAFFRRKCYAKIEDFRKRGKTILLVTHGMEIIKEFCDKAMLIDNGKIAQIGESKDVTNLYYKILNFDNPDEEKETLKKDYLNEKDKSLEVTDNREQSQENEHKFLLCNNKLGNKEAVILEYGILDNKNDNVTTLETGKEYTVFIKALFNSNISDISLGFSIRTVRGLILFGTRTGSFGDIIIPPQKKGNIIVARFKITMRLASEKEYFLTFGLNNKNITTFYDLLEDALKISVISTKYCAKFGLVNLEPTISLEYIS
ncbi:MAG: ABC transporter ATP-binding protein [Spirochaetota bacterium]|nr:ABC transporter ATP-binding protein [Spirochaetota bacterium]